MYKRLRSLDGTSLLIPVLCLSHGTQVGGVEQAGLDGWLPHDGAGLCHLRGQGSMLLHMDCFSGEDTQPEGTEMEMLYGSSTVATLGWNLDCVKL